VATLRRCVRSFVESRHVQRAILVAILLNSVSMGIEYHNQVLSTAHTVIHIQNVQDQGQGHNFVSLSCPRGRGQFYLTSSGRSPCSSLYSRQAGVSGFWFHRLERPASTRRICAVSRGFQTTTQDLSVFPFLPRHYNMTRVLLSPFITTVWTPAFLALINISATLKMFMVMMMTIPVKRTINQS